MENNSETKSDMSAARPAGCSSTGHAGAGRSGSGAAPFMDIYMRKAEFACGIKSEKN